MNKKAAKINKYLKSSRSNNNVNISQFTSVLRINQSGIIEMRPISTMVYSPRTSAAKQVKSVAVLELNSYKIDTSSLEDKARQIQLLKSSLESQISQYKTSELAFHEEIQNLTRQNQEQVLFKARLRSRVKKLQTQLNKLKTQPLLSPRTQSKPKAPNCSNQIKILNNKIVALQGQVASLKLQLQKKCQHISSLQEYKKMYNIEVENKNNIMNFYQKKLAMFQRDKGALISKYEEKISQLGSGLQLNATMIQLQKTNSVSALPGGVKKSQHNTLKYISQKDTGNSQVYSLQQKSPSTKNIKLIRPSKQTNPIETKKPNQQSQGQEWDENSFKLRKNSSIYELRNKQNTEYQRKTLNNQLNQIQDLSSVCKQDDIFLSRDVKESPRKTNKLRVTPKRLKSDQGFMQMMRQIFENLIKQDIRSETLKNFSSVRGFLNISNPKQSQASQLLQKFPFGPLQIQGQKLDQCVEKIKKHLEKKYSTWSGSLVVELLIDKIEDIQIAYEVNSKDDIEMMVGLSSDQDND